MRFRLPTSSFQRRTKLRVTHSEFCFGSRTSNVGSPLRRWLGWLVVTAAGPFAAATGLAQLTNALPAGPDFPAADFSLLRVLGALLLVMALFLLGVWAFKHWQRLALYRGRSPKLNILEVKPLGNRAALYVIAYERERMLVASSPGGVRLLTALPASETRDAAAPSPTFLQTLEQALTPAKSNQL